MPVLFLEVQEKISSFESTFFSLVFFFFFYFYSKKMLAKFKKKLVLWVASSWNLIFPQSLYFYTFIQILREKKK